MTIALENGIRNLCEQHGIDAQRILAKGDAIECLRMIIGQTVSHYRILEKLGGGEWESVESAEPGTSAMVPSFEHPIRP